MLTVKRLRKLAPIKFISRINPEQRYLITVPAEHLTPEVRVIIQAHLNATGLKGVVVPDNIQFYELPEINQFWRLACYALLCSGPAMYVLDRFFHLFRP